MNPPFEIVSKCKLCGAPIYGLPRVDCPFDYYGAIASDAKVQFSCNCRELLRREVEARLARLAFPSLQSMQSGDVGNWPAESAGGGATG